MNEQEQRIAIAEACGEVCPACRNTGIMTKWSGEDYKRLRIINPEFPEIQPDVMCGHPSLPDYLRDLNSMADAEKTLSVALFSDYTSTIARMAHSDGQSIDRFHMRYVCATAPQRAEAFLRTIGKWKD